MLILFPNFTGHFGDNELKIQKVTENWISSTLSWNNQPSVTTTNEITIPRASNEKQNYKVDVGVLVNDMLANGNFGFRIKHTVETPSKITCFTTSEEQNAAIRPKLVIYYH